MWINVLSLFDGMSCWMLALQRAGIKVDKYFASEIDKYAIQVSEKNFPEIKHIGDITNIFTSNSWNKPIYAQAWHWEWFVSKNSIDIIIWGSPCQWFSFAGKQLNFEDPRSKLFFEYVRILKDVKPKYFILENVKMKKEYQDIISENLFGVQPIEINSSLVSAQNRRRLYWIWERQEDWTYKQVHIEQPEDEGILLKDIILDDVEPVVLHNLYWWFKEKEVRVFENKSPTIRTAQGWWHIPSFIKKDLILSPKAIEYMKRSSLKWSNGKKRLDIYSSDIKNDKSVCITANFFKGIPYNVFKDWNCIRKFHPIECERLQTVPDNYTSSVSNSQRYKMLGNWWTVSVISHILSHIKQK